MSRCKLCLIPDAVPGITLSASGICNICREDKSALEAQLAAEEESRAAFEKDLEETLTSARGQGEYDCLVALSGGKDSLYLLHRLKRDYGLRVLAFTVDVNIPALAWDNIRRTVDILDLDHLVYRPSPRFYEKLFRYLLRNQEERGAVYTVSYVYAPLFEGDAIKLAITKGIPLVFAGYSPGQPEPERMRYEFSRKLVCETDWTPPELKRCGDFTDEELARFYNPQRFPKDTNFPRYLAPFHAWPYHQEDIMRKVTQLGFVAAKKNASPVHSNYPINWLLMYSDLKSFGYNPYSPEFAALIRRGQANRAQWRIMAPAVDFMIRHGIGPGREVGRSLRWLKLSPDELRITKPRGVYDPVII